MNKTNKAALLLNSLSIYKGVLNRSVPNALFRLVCSIDSTPEVFLNAYGDFYKLLCERECSEKLCRNLTEAILFDENCFAKTATAGNIGNLSENELNAVIRDIRAILFAGSLTADEIINDYKYYDELSEVLNTLPKWNCGEPLEPFINFDGKLDKIIKFHKINGCGIFARYRSFVWRESEIQPIINDDTVRLDTLIDYESQRNIVIENTKAFLNGKKANNCLLYGDMGTGKSTTVKAVVNEYRQQGLRIVEVPKEQLMEFPILVDKIAGIPMKFIIFIDDLSFQRRDECYTSLKAVLEGGVAALPPNALIYATSNRRHLVKENFEDRDCSDINRRDNMQETLSLSDRFGLSIGYFVPDKKKYLHIVDELAKANNINITEKELHLGAEQFAAMRATRSPRTAQQYIKSLL
ncbi:MAG: ATP-binding protein [Ruminococcus sp.]|nr:ATP-binding protein [Ruminococcus sp.]